MRSLGAWVGPGWPHEAALFWRNENFAAVPEAKNASGPGSLPVVVAGKVGLFASRQIGHRQSA